MTESSRLEASARVALAAMLHDLGKFAERAKLPAVPADAIATHQQIYCPRREQGSSVWYTHKHAAYTALAFDHIEDDLPPVTGQDVSPFAGWNSREVDDSMINAAARHHRPETFLQWIVATADRAASGFERESFERYNEADEKTETGKNHYQARLLTLFEQIEFEARAGTRKSLEYRYPLQPLSPSAMFPQATKDCEPGEDTRARAEYLALWQGFTEALKQIPPTHRSSLSVWLDHFDTLWQTYTHAIPSATAFGAKPEVPLYDHSKAVAALAVALWRYHHDLAHDTGEVLEKLRRPGRPDWDEHKLLLVQGDFFGIQKFIFSGGGDSKRKAAKLLRGRSFYVSLITECAALKVLDALDLPPTSQITNAAGKFLIVAPNTPEAVAQLQGVQRELDAWFLRHSYGEAGLGLAWEPAGCNDFLRGEDHTTARFQALMNRLHQRLERAKYRHFGLCGTDSPRPVFDAYLDRFDNRLGACAVNDRAPAEVEDGGAFFSTLAADQIRAGDLLVKCDRLILSREELTWRPDRSLRLPIFGYRVHFTGNEDEAGQFGQEVRKGNIRRLFDYSLPELDGQRPLWNGYARRNIRGYVPVFADREWDDPLYDGIKLDDEERFAQGDLKTLHHLACEDKSVKALHTLKGDIDDLGAIFQQGLANPSFAKMAALSRQVNNYFTVYLPWLCQTEFPETYTVFAGGDDFFLIGPWFSQVRLARRMRQSFAAYVQNPAIHFSAGLAMTKPAIPIQHLAEVAEEGLVQAKKREGKNAMTVFGRTVSWAELEQLWQDFERLSNMAAPEAYDLSTAYIYGLLGLADMAEAVKVGGDVANARWRSFLAYRTWRMIRSDRNKNRDEQKAMHQQIAALLSEAIEQFGAKFKIALHLHLYQQRG